MSNYIKFVIAGTTVNRAVKNAREYTTRAYRGLLKNGRVMLTNTLRFILSVSFGFKIKQLIKIRSVIKRFVK